MSGTAPLPRRPHYDGLRGMLFVAVFVFHHDMSVWQLSYALPMFFVMSGFLITLLLLGSGSLDNRTAFRNFLVRRGLRIIPAYYVVLSIAAFVGSIEAGLWHATYTFNIWLFKESVDGLSFLRSWAATWEMKGGHFWSLCLEEQFYVIYPAAVFLVPRRLFVHCLASLWVLSIAARCWFVYNMPMTLFGALPIIPFEFLVIGCLFAVHFHRGLRWPVHPNLSLWAALGLLAIAFALDNPRPEFAIFQFQPGYNQTIYAVLIGVAAYSVWLCKDGWLIRLLSLKPITYLGKISYSMYLIHLFVYPVGRHVEERLGLPPLLGRYLITYVVTVALASLNWFVFERRLNALKRFFPLGQAAAT